MFGRQLGPRALLDTEGLKGLWTIRFQRKWGTEAWKAVVETVGLTKPLHVFDLSTTSPSN